MKWQVAFFFISILYVSGQIHYSILEELKLGSIVGNIANDLGLSVTELSMRRLQIAPHNKKYYFNISLENGNLYVVDRIDRESICEIEKKCMLNLEILAKNPLTVYYVKIEIQDINDNYPLFSKNIFNLSISELTLPGTHFALVKAVDPDLGVNSLQSYNLSPSQYFKLGEKTSVEGMQYPELILEKHLDREKQSFFELILTASDGGKPVKTGTAVLRIVVQDVNDNYPVFGQDTYRISLKEDAPNGFLVLHVDATDEDEGSNAQITYSFSHSATNKMDIFILDPESGEIKLSDPLDYEVKQNYEMTVEAKDGGGLVTYCTVLIQVVDVNDNAPEIQLVSLTNPISEDSVPGTMVAEFQVKDLDSERNGEVSCEITEALLFKLMPTSTNYYRLVTLSSLDRETLSMYNITIIAKDEGSPQLLTKKVIQIVISDVNDNPPFFDKLNYIVYVSENNQPGTSIYRIQASDLDSEKNARIAYSIFNRNISDIPISSYISMNSKTGVIRAQRSFDYEQLRDFNFQVIAKDSGSPSLSSNVTVRLCVIDKNDNAPKILYPSQDMDGTSMFEYIPHSAKNGYLVTKVIAVDLDSGHNGWLSYHLLQVPDPSFLIIVQHTGEIRLARDFKDSDSLRQKIVVLVKDNGLPSLSATVTLNFVMAEDFQQAFPEIVKQPKESDVSSNGTFYLVIAITFISILFIVTVAVTVIAKCRRQHNPNSPGALSRTWYPQLSLNYPTQFSDGSLPLPYSYDVCVTLDSKQNEIAYLKQVQNVPTDNLIDTDDSLVVNETEVGSTQVRDEQEPNHTEPKQL
uniref:Cadherin domain-containing protein n=1 Tax=Leptobrachium leishanense TaxID=445787 RepID=A0A8C5PI91_9ANUR